MEAQKAWENGRPKMEAQGAWENGRRKTLIHAPAKPRACENPQTTSWRTLARATKSLGFRV